MFTMFKAVTAILAGIALVVDASPLVRRDVIAPKITNPKAGSVWPVGSTQTVTWETSDLPPVSQITNIIGQVILGFDANDSLNLDFDHPLAKGFNLTTGSVKLTVPNVPPRKDYLIVLFGDSGNTSPTFSITAISVPGSSGSSSSSHSTTATTSFDPTSPPLTGSTITGGESSTADESATVVTGSVTTQAQPESTSTSTTETSSAPLTSSTTPSSSTSPTGTGTALPGNATSAGWSLHRSTSSPMLFIGAAISAFILL